MEFTIPEDDLSLEPNKTLRLKMELVSSTLRLPTSPAVFFRDSIDIIIVDPDVASECNRSVPCNCILIVARSTV